MKIIFLGTPDIAAYILEQIIAYEYSPVLVVTKEDTPSGRGMKLQPSAVKEVALAHDIPLAQASSLKKNPQVVEQIRAVQPDLMIVVAYGCILSKEVLEIPKYGCINVHASLLPQWRGAAPIQRSLLADDKITGITIMEMDVGLDTGDILLQQEIVIDSKETHGSLYQKMKQVGADSLLKYLDNRESIIPQKQNEELVTYAEKMQKQEALINFSKPALQVDLHIRGFNPPGSFTYLDGVLYKIWEAEVCQFDHKLESNHGGLIVQSDSKGLIVQCGLENDKPTFLKIHILQIAGKARQNSSTLVQNSDFIGKIFTAQI